MRVKINDLVFDNAKVIFGKDGSMAFSCETDYKIEDVADKLMNAESILVTDEASTVVYFNKKLQAYRYEMPNKLEVSYVVSLIADETIESGNKKTCLTSFAATETAAIFFTFSCHYLLREKILSIIPYSSAS